MTEQPSRRDPRIVIIGAGMAGIAVAHTFKQAGFNDFVILEKGSDIGGVWHWNRYPGLRCDIPSHAYQFAFAPKPDWKHIWASGEEIQQYHREVVECLQLDRHLRLGCEVTSAVFTDNRWRVFTANGDEIDADFLVAAPVCCTTPSSRRFRVWTHSPDRSCIPPDGPVSRPQASAWR